MVGSVVEVFGFAFFSWHDQKVESIEDVLLLLLPVIVVEVVVHPHEPLINKLWYDVLFSLQIRRLRQFDG